MILTAGTGGNAVAETGKGRLHARSPAAEERLPQQARPGPMSYYGGPKSPMWRGSAEH